jgi:DNA-binding NarL/FixJ family response regulator
MEPIRILIADDHPLVRTGIQALLASVPDMAVVGTAASGEEAIAAAGELEPDIILMDLHMPGVNGIEATRRIVRDRPDIGILVLTMLDDDDSVFAAMRAGARGYLLKGADQTEVLRAIGVVAYHTRNAISYKPSALLLITRSGKPLGLYRMVKLHYLGHRAFHKMLTLSRASMAGTLFAHFRLTVGSASAKRDRRFTVHLH